MLHIFAVERKNPELFLEFTVLPRADLSYGEAFLGFAAWVYTERLMKTA
jgi:hypothetical protein